MPIGVNADGYDVWRHRDLFVPDMSVGAPPDIVTTSGQDWVFPPLSPEALRRSRYAYVRDYLRNHLAVAGILRLDHAMGLYRLYWVPEGMGARNGVYVRYPFDELAAVHSLESHRHQALIAGEDLGLVPTAVQRGLDRHGVSRMHILIVSLAMTGKERREDIPGHVVASIGTHDLPPFAAYWQETDIEERRRLGVLSDERAAIERRDRSGQRQSLLVHMRELGLLTEDEPTLEQVMQAVLALLGSSPAEREVVNMEDLWLETLPQNIPATNAAQHPNWRRRARYSVEEMLELPQVRHVLARVREARAEAHGQTRTAGRRS
jgi:4-alpha-glucanotransferase